MKKRVRFMEKNEMLQLNIMAEIKKYQAFHEFYLKFSTHFLTYNILRADKYVKKF